MGELIIIILFFILGLFVVIFSFQLPDVAFQTLGPSIFPRIIGIALLIFAIIYLFEKASSYKKQQKSLLSILNVNTLFSISKIKDQYRFVVITMINFLIYILLMRYVGFRISNFLFLIVTQWLLGPRNIKTLPVIIFTSVFITFGLFYFFQYFLNVHFPEGIFFEYLK